MAKKNFETALNTLETLADELENGDLSLDVSLKKFDEAIKLVDFCNNKLAEARATVAVLLEKNDGTVEEPFEDLHESDE